MKGAVDDRKRKEEVKSLLVWSEVAFLSFSELKWACVTTAESDVEVVQKRGINFPLEPLSLSFFKNGIDDGETADNK